MLSNYCYVLEMNEKGNDYWLIFERKSSKTRENWKEDARVDCRIRKEGEGK